LSAESGPFLSNGNNIGNKMSTTLSTWLQQYLLHQPVANNFQSAVYGVCYAVLCALLCSTSIDRVLKKVLGQTDRRQEDGVLLGYCAVERRWLSPIWEGSKLEESVSPRVDGHLQDSYAHHVHHESRFGLMVELIDRQPDSARGHYYHIHYSHISEGEDNRIGRRRNGQHEGEGRWDSHRNHEVERVDAGVYRLK
jgi:hypothetical protein